MRMIDVACYWSQGTHDNYQPLLQRIRRFGDTFDVPTLKPMDLERPSSSPDIVLQWVQEAYSLQFSPVRKEEGLAVPISFGTIRQLRAAASQFYGMDLMVADPSATYMDKQRRLIRQPCRPTDGIGYTFHAKGMGTRLGTKSVPSVALLDQHIRFLLRELEEKYQQATRPAIRRKYALAGFATTLFWLGWLRSQEGFMTRWSDYDVTEPEDAGRHDLPVGVGVIGCRLRPETKSSRSVTADVVMAYRTISGFKLGLWFHRARRACNLDGNWQDCSRLVFTHATGGRWTSKYFREEFLYPSLYRQQAAGDPYLAPFNGEVGSGNSIPEKFWSMHCLRRGARTSSTLRTRGITCTQFRPATLEQVYEHARWRLNRGGEKIDKQYQEWPMIERIQITLYSM
jgi:hypothetical protein